MREVLKAWAKMKDRHSLPPLEMLTYSEEDGVHDYNTRKNKCYGSSEEEAVISAEITNRIFLNVSFKSIEFFS